MARTSWIVIIVTLVAMVYYARVFLYGLVQSCDLCTVDLHIDVSVCACKTDRILIVVDTKLQLVVPLYVRLHP